MIEQLIKTSRGAVDLLSRLMRIVCVGEVSAVDGGGQRAKVVLPSYDNMESEWLRVLALRSLGVRTSCNLKVGEQVLCLFPPLGDMMGGYVLGALYNQRDAPFQDNPDVFGVAFEDGAKLTYDQVSHTLQFSMPGGSQLFEMTPDGVRLVSKFDIDGEVTISKNLTVAEGIEADTVSDSTGTMATIRNQYNEHGHPDNGAGKPTVEMS
jgi:phage baseplate assembly protein V